MYNDAEDWIGDEWDEEEDDTCPSCGDALCYDYECENDDLDDADDYDRAWDDEDWDN